MEALLEGLVRIVNSLCVLEKFRPLELVLQPVPALHDIGKMAMDVLRSVIIVHQDV